MPSRTLPGSAAILGPGTGRHELTAHRLLTQDDRSGTGQLYNRWLRSIGVNTENAVLSNSVVALTGLTVSGMGISYLPSGNTSKLLRSVLCQALFKHVEKHAYT
ncbi:LysR substrate-binding domain-containing protein [Cupriavidus necator]